MEKNASDILREIYESLDKPVKEISEKAKVTCTKGCAHCCELLALATFAEGLIIAESIGSKPDWKSVIPRLKKASMEFCFSGITEKDYFKKGIKCVFLGADNLCSIYEIRPSCCRYHLALSNPLACSRSSPEDTKTKLLDFRAMESHVWDFSAALCKSINLPPFIAAPIPIMVLFALTKIMEPDEDLNWLLQEISEVPTPLEWFEKYAGSLTGGTVGKREKLNL